MKLTVTADNIGRALLALQQEELPIILETRPARKRSTEQNSRLWALHTLTAKHLNEQREMLLTVLRNKVRQIQSRDLTQVLGQIFALTPIWTAEDVHEQIFKPRFVHPRRQTSSTRLSKLQMADAQTEYEAWMIGQGIEPEQMERAA